MKRVLHTTNVSNKSIEDGRGCNGHQWRRRGSEEWKVVHNQTGWKIESIFNFSFNHPVAHKLAVPHKLFKRAQRLCTNPVERTKEEKHIETALRSNGYPKNIIQKPPLQAQSQPQDPPEATVVLPYTHRVSEPIRRILSPLKIRKCFRPHRTLRNILTRVKDPTAPEDRAGVVYHIPCQVCTLTYVGQTDRTMTHRLKEHRQALSNGSPSASAVADHANDSGHAIAWDYASVIDSSSQCSALEAWHMRSQPHPLDREHGMLLPVYDRLVAHTLQEMDAHAHQLQVPSQF